jgi:tRNA A37 methylthiotransferase MiaB
MRGEKVKSSHQTQMVGRTMGDQIVVFDAPISCKGELVDLEIVEARHMTLIGKRIDVAQTAAP